MKKISQEELSVLAKYIYDISGIHLDNSKGYLLETRLKPLLNSYHCNSYSEIYYKAKADMSGEIREKIIDAISTNETLFFRDQKPFQLLENKIIPDLIDKRSKTNRGGRIPIRIWSAACSYGQEVYSTIITLMEMLPNFRNYDVSILGTDIADEAIARASYGKYNKFEIDRGLPRHYLNKYFNQTGDGWRIKDEVRVMANYKKMNLMEPFMGIGPFDIVFCRNVAIYFSRDDKIKLFRKIARVMAPDGYLILGGSENLNGIPNDYDSKNYLRAMFYQPKGAGVTADKHDRPVRPRPAASVFPQKTVAPKPRPVAPPPRPKPVAPSRPIQPPVINKPAVTSAPAAQVIPKVVKPVTPVVKPVLTEPLKPKAEVIPVPSPPPPPVKPRTSIYAKKQTSAGSLLSNLQGRSGMGKPVNYGKSGTGSSSLLQRVQSRSK